MKSLYRRFWTLIPILIALISVLSKSPWTSAQSYGWPDTASYFHSWEILKSGYFDCFRTPLYPIFIGLIHDLFPSAALTLILIIQNTLYILSASSLAIIGRKALRLPRWIAIAASVPYCTAYVYNLYPDFILTDSLAASLFIFYVRATLSFISSPRPIRTGILGGASFALVMLRPSFLFIPIAALCIAPFLRSTSRNASRGLLAGAIFCLAATGAYACIYHAYAGKWGVSSVADVNILMMHSRYKSDFDPEAYPLHYALSHHPEMRLEVWDAVSIIAAHQPWKIYTEVEEIQNERPEFTFLATRSSIYRNLRYNIAHTPVPLFAVPIFLLLYTPLVLRRLYKHNPIAISGMWLWLLMCGQFAIIILNAPNEYQRLLMPVFPLIFIACADMLRTAIKAVPLPRQETSC